MNIKKLYPGMDCALIDDTRDNIRQWKEAGGTGILYEGVEETLEALARLEAE